MNENETFFGATSFGVTASGEAMQQIILRDGAFSCGILTYGAALRFLTVPDSQGRPVDVVLGFDSIDDYQKQDKYVGALIGRHANRIGGSSFTLDGQTYPLLANDGANHLHGGGVGFDKQIWNVESVSDRQVMLSLVSPHMQEGYPGTLSVLVTYTLLNGALSIQYTARTDRMTVCNLTNHSYFNLAGHDSGPVLKQEMQIFAESFTPANSESLPVGVLAPVEGTPLDLRRSTPIGAHIDDDFDQLVWAGGYDHNWAVDGAMGALRPAARALCRETGISMDVETTLPGIQFYSANYLDGCPAGKGGAPYAKRWAFCLETQFFPNATNCPAFAQPVLAPGETFDHTTVYRFGTI